MISVEFYINSSDKRVINKTLTETGAFSCTLKNGTNIINPVFVISGVDGAFINSNYVVVPDFKRKYFINNIVSVANGVWEVSCHVDVLSSFYHEITDNNAIINRQASKWNLFLNDNSFQCYQNPYIVQKQFPNGFSTSALGFSLIVAGQPSADDETEQ